MDFFQQGIYYKEVSQAQLENVLKVYDRAEEAVSSAAAVDWSRNDINRMRLQLTRLKEELNFVLKELGINPMELELFQSVRNDDVVSDGVAQTSDNTDYSAVRYRNFSLSGMDELYSKLDGATGVVLNRVTELVSRIGLVRLKISKAEADMKNKVSARKEFEDKRESDKAGFKNLQKQFLALAEIRGYVEALLDMVYKYPQASSSPTDSTVRATSEQFDLMCWKWRRYRNQLSRAIRDYIDDYSDSPVSIPTFISFDFFGDDKALALTVLGVDLDKIKDILNKKFLVKYDKVSKNYQVFEQNSTLMLEKMKNFESDVTVLPEHFTGVPDMWTTVLESLSVLVSIAFAVHFGLERMLEIWAGGKAKVSTNPVISRTIERARQAILSPVNRTKVDPTTRSEFVEKSLTDFTKTSSKIKEIKDFLESAPDVIRNRIGNLPFDKEFLRKAFLRRDMPVKGNMKGVKPVEDGVRERVRARYGPTVPFEDEVNINSSEEGPPDWKKESLCEQDNSGKWKLKTDVQNEAAKDSISPSKDSGTSET